MAQLEKTLDRIENSRHWDVLKSELATVLSLDGWLVFDCTELCLESEMRAEGFQLISFIGRSGIDVDRPYLYRHDKRRHIYSWYQDPREGVN